MPLTYAFWMTKYGPRGGTSSRAGRARVARSSARVLVQPWTLHTRAPFALQPNDFRLSHSAPRAPFRMRACAATSPSSSPPVRFMRARHILVESEAMADAAIERLNHTNDADRLFTELARTLSTCDSRRRGGDLGWFRRGQMVPEFEQACLQAPLHTFLKAQSGLGWHVIQVLERGSQRGVMEVEEFAEIYRDAQRRAQYQLVDVREPSELARARLDGFLNLPINAYDQWREQVEGDHAALDKGRPVIVMCHHGFRSATMCSYLSQQGFRDVINLLGGIDAYAQRVDATVPRY
eukprot:ctg_1418.g494